MSTMSMPRSPARSRSARKALIEPQDQFWGDRFAQFEDPDGYRWAIARHLRLSRAAFSTVTFCPLALHAFAGDHRHATLLR